MGVMLHDRNRAQVSMNLTDFEQTPVHAVFDAVRRQAAVEGTAIEASEIVGLIPRKALEMAASFYLQVDNFHPGLVLENRLAESLARAPGSGLGEFLAQLAAPTPTPGGGSAAAAAAAMAASLGEMVAGLAGEKNPAAKEMLPAFGKARAFFEHAVWRDAAAYDAVRDAYRVRKEQRAAPLEAALQGEIGRAHV